MASEKQPYILISLYLSLYKERYNKAVTINKFREKWAMQDVIDSVGYDRAVELLKYYFKTAKSGHPLNFFYNNFFFKCIFFRSDFIYMTYSCFFIKT